MFQVCANYEIPRASLRDHLVERTRGEKISTKAVLTMVEEEELVDYMHQVMVH